MKSFLQRVSLAAALLGFAPLWVLGQNGAFVVSSTPAPLILTEKTALLGSITFTLSSGTTGAGTLVVDFAGAPIVNDGATGVTVTGSGGLAGATLASVDPSSSRIRISVPGGAGSGAILLEGVRIDEAAARLSALTATISVEAGSGFGILAGGTEVSLITSASQGLTVKSDSTTVLTYENIPVITSVLRLTIGEGFDNVFTDGAAFGQTNPTQVRIEVTDLPAGSQITFPAVVTSGETGATLTVLAGSELTLPDSSGGTSLTYQFASGVGSAGTIESFSFVYTLDVQSAPSEPAVVSLQATLAPSDDTSIPSFVEELVPAEADLPFPEFKDVVATPPGINTNFLGFAFTNGTSSNIFLELRAIDSTGQLLTGAGLTNPVDLMLAPGVQQAGLLEELFGTAILGADLGTVVVTSRKRRAVVLFLMGDTAGTFLDGAMAGPLGTKSFIFPLLGRGGEAPFTIVQLFNPSTTASLNVTLELRNADGSVLAQTSPQVLAPEAVLEADLDTLFGQDPVALGGRYVAGVASSEILGFELFGNKESLNVLAAQAVAQRLEEYRVPHFAVGGGYDTEISLVNVDPLKTAGIEIDLFDDAGNALAVGGGSSSLSLQPGEESTVALSSLLGPTSGSIVVGSARVKVARVFAGPFSSVPAVAGAVRIRTGGERISATLPLFEPARTSSLFPHVAQNLGFFTGVAVVNPEKSDVQVTVSVFDQAGHQVGSSSSFTLPPGGRRARLLSELVPQSSGQVGGYFRVAAPSGVISFALFGDVAGQFISAIPSQ